MVDWSTLGEWFLNIGSYIAVFGSILSLWHRWVYKPLQEKREEREEEYRREMLKIANKQTEPISEIIKEMNEGFKEHNRHADERDRLIAQNAEIIKKHEERFDAHGARLDVHNERLIVLETKNGVRKVTYKEESDE